MNFNELYLFTVDLKPGALQVAFEGELSFARHLAILQGHYDPEPPLTVRETKGARAYDVIDSASVLLQLVSPRFRTALREAAITGWDTVPINPGPFEQLKGYELLRVSGQCGPIDDSQSERAIIRSPTKEGRAVDGWRGLYFDPASWDGADIFGPPDTGEIFMTKKAAHALRQLQPSNILLEPLPSIERRVL